ncbi:hypothetical protein PIB30_082806, partial [Stylosanthes scabra]|nr:hypothetical protein [Stylosanthes scabra]
HANNFFLAILSELSARLQSLQPPCVFAVLDDLRKDLDGDVWKRDTAVGAIVDHVLDGLRFRRHCLVHLEGLSVRALEVDLPR